MTDIEEEELGVTSGSDIQDAINAGIAIQARTVFDILGIAHTLVPPGYSLIGHPELSENPKHTKQKVRVTTAGAFIEYYNHFENDESAIFCDVENAKFKGIIDYHGNGKPAWCRHILVYTCIATEEWATWTVNNGKIMQQEEFALFIEQNLEEVIKPNGAELLEIATTLRTNTKARFTSAKRLDNGQTQFEYHEEIDGVAGIKGQLKIPEQFELGLSVFDDGTAYKLQAKFRYRIKDGQVRLWYDLIRPHKTYRAALDDIFKQIEEEVDCNLIVHGSPL